MTLSPPRIATTAAVIALLTAFNPPAFSHSVDTGLELEDDSCHSGSDPYHCHGLGGRRSSGCTGP